MADVTLRCLTPTGIDEFARYLRRLRAEPNLPVPKALLADTKHSVASALGDVSVEERGFANRREFAQYMDSRFNEGGVFVDADEAGLWEWLSLFYFDAVCPPDAEGTRKPGVEGRHLLRDADARRRFRHLLRSPYLLYRRYGGGPHGELDLLLSYRLSVHGVAATHIAERTRLMASAGALAAASRLYFDRAAGRPKQGYSDEEKGLRAYCKFLNNLPDCFDLSRLSADTVVALLPAEFDAWIGDESEAHLKETRTALQELQRADAATGAEVASHLDGLLDGLQDRKVGQRHSLVRSDLFRTAILGAYDSTCAVSGLGLRHHRTGPESPTYEVEAAHIIPVARGGRDHVQNGLALNRTVHWAFDEGVIWIDDRLRVAVAKDVERDQRNQWLMQFRERPLTIPNNARHVPNSEALRWHATNIAGER